MEKQLCPVTWSACVELNAPWRCWNLWWGAARWSGTEFYVACSWRLHLRWDITLSVAPTQSIYRCVLTRLQKHLVRREWNTRQGPRHEVVNFLVLLSVWSCMFWKMLLLTQDVKIKVNWEIYPLNGNLVIYIEGLSFFCASFQGVIYKKNLINSK